MPWIREHIGKSSMGSLRSTQTNCLNLGFKIDGALLTLWVWVEVEGFRDYWITILELWSYYILILFQNWSSHLKSHIYLDWKVRSSLTYNPRFAHASFQFLGCEGETWAADAFHFGVDFSNFGVDDHLCIKTTFTHYGKHWPPAHWLWPYKMLTIWMRLAYFIVSNQTTH